MIVCPNCLTKNEDNAEVCSHCQADLNAYYGPSEEELRKQADAQAKVILEDQDRLPKPTYTFQLFLTFLTSFCMFPWNLPALIFAAIAHHQAVCGRHEEASIAYRKSHNWFWVTFSLWLIKLALYIALSQAREIPFPSSIPGRTFPF